MSNSPTGNETMKQNIDLSTDENGLSKAVATLSTDKGEIKFKFYTKDAPDTVNRIVELIQSGFYNGIVFHRVEGWVVQTGDPTGTGTGGSGQNIKAEFNNRKHQAGSVGMARTADPDSADSQFYFVFGPQPHLDHNYTVFAQVIEGLDVLKTISRGDKMNSLSVK